MRNILACKARRFVLLTIGVLVATGAWTAPAFQAPGRAAPGGVASALEAAIAEVEAGRKKPRVLDWLIARQAIEPNVAVFVDSHGDDHLADAAVPRFLTDERLGWVASRFGVTASADQRGIIGISFGAKDALDAALISPGAFDRLGLLIPGRRLGRTDLDAIAGHRDRRLRVSILAGQYDGPNLATARGARQALAGAGHTVDYTEVPEGHNQAAWRNHLRVVLVGLFGSTQQERFPVLEGPYFGQAPPGDVPQRFAPGFLSTAGYDLTPTFSPALDEVFFGRRPTEDGSDNKIFHSRMVNGRWQRPALASFSSGAVEYEAQFSVDGNTLYFNRGKLMYFSRRTDTGWSEARAIDPPADEGMCIAVARNGTLYFTAARNKVYGIFRSQRVDGRYQVPEIVIPMAAHPWVAPDESYLVFDKYAFSEGVQTSKLFIAFRQKDGTWSAPIELGKNINATGTELIAKMSPDGKFLFFQRKVNGNTDIYWVDAKVIDAVRDSAGRK